MSRILQTRQAARVQLGTTARLAQHSPPSTLVRQALTTHTLPAPTRRPVCFVHRACTVNRQATSSPQATAVMAGSVQVELLCPSLSVLVSPSKYLPF